MATANRYFRCPRCWQAIDRDPKSLPVNPATVPERFRHIVASGVGLRLHYPFRRKEKTPKVKRRVPTCIRCHTAIKIRGRVGFMPASLGIWPPYSCAKCRRSFQAIGQLLNHLRSGCWNVHDFDAIPRTSRNRELDWQIGIHTLSDAIRYDDYALGELLIVATPMLRYAAGLTPHREYTSRELSRKHFLQWAKSSLTNPAINAKTKRPHRYDISGDDMGIGYQTVITDIERTRERDRNQKGWPKLNSEQEAYGQVKAWMEDELQRWSNLQRSAVQSEKRKDRHHGVFNLPTKKKSGGKAKGKCKRKPDVIRPIKAGEEEWTDHQRYLTEDDASIFKDTAWLNELRCDGETEG